MFTLDRKKTIFWVIGPILIILLLVMLGYFYTSNNNRPNDENKIESNSKGNPSNQVEFQEEPPFLQGDRAVHVYVVGTIYRNIGNITVYASCYDDLGHGLDSNATVVIYNKDNATFLPLINMTSFGGGNHKYIGLVPNTTGNYFVVVNCSSGSDWGMGYNEFQVPDWLDTLLNSSNHTSDYVLLILNQTTQISNDTQTIINITNTTQGWVEKMMEYWGIKTYTCLNIYNDVSTTATRGETWEIRSWVTDEYNTTQTGSDVSCNISTSFWGQFTMDYSAITERFIYYNYLNNSGTLIYNVTCEEWDYETQNSC